MYKYLHIGRDRVAEAEFGQKQDLFTVSDRNPAHIKSTKLNRFFWTWKLKTLFFLFFPLKIFSVDIFLAKSGLVLNCNTNDFILFIILMSILRIMSAKVHLSIHCVAYNMLGFYTEYSRTPIGFQYPLSSKKVKIPEIRPYAYESLKWIEARKLNFTYSLPNFWQPSRLTGIISSSSSL